MNLGTDSHCVHPFFAAWTRNLTDQKLPSVGSVKDGVYVDATFRDHKTAIAAVYVRGSVPRVAISVRIRARVESVNDAERIAVALGRIAFPGFPLFTDSMEAAWNENVCHVYRELNKYAHREADRAYRITELNNAIEAKVLGQLGIPLHVTKGGRIRAIHRIDLPHSSDRKRNQFASSLA